MADLAIFPMYLLAFHGEIIKKSPCRTEAVSLDQRPSLTLFPYFSGSKISFFPKKQTKRPEANLIEFITEVVDVRRRL